MVHLEVVKKLGSLWFKSKKSTICRFSTFLWRANLHFQNLKDNCDYDWMFSEEDNWKKYFEKELNNDWKEFFKGKKYGMAGGIDNNTGSGAIVSGLKIFCIGIT